MDASLFSSATGELVEISTLDGDDWAFIPAPLPPKWSFPPGLWPLLSEAKVALARLDERTRTSTQPALLLAPLRRREAVHSSSLEGTHATAQEVYLFEMGPREVAVETDARSDWNEVFNYDAALQYGYSQLNDPSPNGLPLSLRLIHNMHRILLGNIHDNRSRGGEVRARQVHIGSSRRYIPPPPGARLAECLTEFERYMHADAATLDPLVRAYLVHYQFEAIHPYLDGNGRVGRALLALMTFRWTGLDQPWLYMSAYFERYKDEYVNALFRISTQADWAGWIGFCLRGTIEQCHDAMRRCSQLTGLRDTMRRSLTGRPRMHEIIERLFERPFFTINDVAAWVGVTRPTAKSAITELVALGFAAELGGGRPRVYYAPQIYRAAYDEEVVTRSSPQRSSGS